MTYETILVDTRGSGERRAIGFEPLAKIGERRVVHAGWTRSGIAGLPADTVSTS